MTKLVITCRSEDLNILENEAKLLDIKVNPICYFGGYFDRRYPQEMVDLEIACNDVHQLSRFVTKCQEYFH